MRLLFHIIHRKVFLYPSLLSGPTASHPVLSIPSPKYYLALPLPLHLSSYHSNPGQDLPQPSSIASRLHLFPLNSEWSSKKQAWMCHSQLKIPQRAPPPFCKSLDPKHGLNPSLSSPLRLSLPFWCCEEWTCRALRSGQHGIISAQRPGPDQNPSPTKCLLLFSLPATPEIGGSQQRIMLFWASVS